MLKAARQVDKRHNSSLPSVLTRTIRYAIERKRTEELLRTRDMAVEASRLKSTFMNNISHELRTPLTGILGMNDLLLSTTLNNKQLNYAATVQKCAQDMLEVVTDLIDIADIELGGITIRQRPLNPLLLVAETVQEIEPYATTRHYGGAGLGLAIGKRLVELMNGQIGVESSKNEGSIFWISVPFSRAA